MFYCDTCKDSKGWPESLSKSIGTCEMCEATAECNDVPASKLPHPDRFASNEVKMKIINDYVEMASKHTLVLFNALDLETHICAKITDEESGDKYEFNFIKINKKDGE